MPFTLLDSLSLPGDVTKPNEDAFGHDENAALVLDGATPLCPSLMPGPSDAAWIAQFGARRLLAHLRDGEAADDALAAALAETEKSFQALARAPVREKWQMPCASMMMVFEVGEGPSPPLREAHGGGDTRSTLSSVRTERVREIEFLWYGDCAALLEQDGALVTIGETLERRGQEAARAKDWTPADTLPDLLEDAALLARLRAARSHINSGRHWLFSPDRRAAAHVRREALPKKPGLLLLATDGFFALVSDYGAYDANGLMQAAKTKGLNALGEELRRIENDDANAARYPRFKKSDDATALLIEVS